MPGRKLSHIKQKYPAEGLEKVLLYWVDTSPKPNLSWSHLVKALRKIREEAKASSISKRFLLTNTAKTGELVYVLFSPHQCVL